MVFTREKSQFHQKAGPSLGGAGTSRGELLREEMPRTTQERRKTFVLSIGGFKPSGVSSKAFKSAVTKFHEVKKNTKNKRA